MNLEKYNAHALAYFESGPTPSRKHVGWALFVIFSACVAPFLSSGVGAFIHEGGDHGLNICLLMDWITYKHFQNNSRGGFDDNTHISWIIVQEENEPLRKMNEKTRQKYYVLTDAYILKLPSWYPSTIPPFPAQLARNVDVARTIISTIPTLTSCVTFVSKFSKVKSPSLSSKL